MGEQDLRGDGFELPWWFKDEFDLARPLHMLNAEERKIEQWSIFPRGWFTEPDRSIVVFDDRRRPICRRTDDGQIAILSVLLEVRYVDQRLFIDKDFYCPPSFYGQPYDNAVIRRQVLGAVNRLGIEGELRRRRALENSGRLIGAGGYHRPA